MHLVRRRWNQLKVGDFIKLKNDPRIWEITMMTGGAGFLVETNGFRPKEVNFTEDYVGSWISSQDCLDFVEDCGRENTGEMIYAWSACEKHYGISHLGSSDPDPLRDLALKILKGDPQALDAARDILKC